MYQPYWINNDELEHFGVIGMKWGIRRYQNKDGSLTAAGKKHYSSSEEVRQDLVSKANAKLEKLDQKSVAKKEKFNRRFEKNKSRIQKADTASFINFPYAYYTAITSISVGATGRRSQRKERKALKWSQKVSKVLGEDALKSTKVGQKYLNMTLEDVTKSNVKMNELTAYIGRFLMKYGYYY